VSLGYLLDTHVFVDMSKGRRLSPGVRAVLDDPNADVCLSVVSIVEICIKANLGKLALPAAIAADPARGFQETADKAGFRLLPLELQHAAQLSNLPLHHRDPFDRLLICQALAENLVLVSDDGAFPLYSGLALLRS
jgi:PIN domain nuclease of toxin-antitoxin system